MKKFTLIASLIGAVGLATATSAQDLGEADAAIKYRKDAMASVGGHTRALVAILKGEIDHQDGLALHANALAAATNADLVSAAFRQNTAGQGSVETTSTAKIWEDWDGFQSEINGLNAEATKVAELAAKGELTSFDQLKPMLSHCGACHRQKGYREN